MTLREGTSLDHRTAGNPYSRIPAVRILTGIEPDATPLDWEGMTKSHSVEARWGRRRDSRAGGSKIRDRFDLVPRVACQRVYGGCLVEVDNGVELIAQPRPDIMM
jgi:hypothetical protein